MKNEPVVTYNHMEEENPSTVQGMNRSPERNHHPISLYMIFIVDIILIGGLIFIAMKTIF